jgi:hypothetical protein
MRDASGWVRVGEQKGSNPGGVFRDETGKNWYLKHAKSDDHAKNEDLSNRLYRAMKVPVLDQELVHHKGKLANASPIEKIRNFNPNSKHDVGAIRKNFGAHAFLANWDAIGEENDNQAHTHRGMTTLDAGGSLKYRAQGSPKGSAFGPKVSEWDSLRHPDNAQAHHVFGGMNDQDLRASAQPVLNLSDDHIRNLVHTHGPGEFEERKKMANTLIKRKRDIASRVGAQKDTAAKIRLPLLTAIASLEHSAKKYYGQLNSIDRRAVAIVLPELAWVENYVDHLTPLKTTKEKPIRKLPLQDLHPDNLKSMENHAKTFNNLEGIIEPGHENSIRNYKGSSTPYNSQLRSGKLDKHGTMQRHIENMKHVTSHVNPKPQTSYRGDNMTTHLPVGHTFTDKGFTGTSLKPSIAGNTDWSRGGNVFAIHAPKGAKSYYLDRHENSTDHEKELTYHPDTHYQVIGHTKHKYNDWSDHSVKATHLAIMGQGRVKGKPDMSLTSSPEGKRWLEHIKKNYASTVEDPGEKPRKPPKSSNSDPLLKKKPAAKKKPVAKTTKIVKKKSLPVKKKSTPKKKDD